MPTTAAWPEDQVEIVGLTVTQALAKVAEARLAEIREQIQAGTYLTPEKMNYVVERLWDLLRATAKEERATA